MYGDLTPRPRKRERGWGRYGGKQSISLTFGHPAGYLHHYLHHEFLCFLPTSHLSPLSILFCCVTPSPLRFKITRVPESQLPVLTLTCNHNLGLRKMEMNLGMTIHFAGFLTLHRVIPAPHPLLFSWQLNVSPQFVHTHAAR